jgi:hypothetical protein
MLIILSMDGDWRAIDGLHSLIMKDFKKLRSTKYLLHATPKALLMRRKHMLKHRGIHNFVSFSLPQVTEHFEQSSMYRFNIWGEEWFRVLQKHVDGYKQ